MREERRLAREKALEEETKAKDKKEKKVQETEEDEEELKHPVLKKAIIICILLLALMFVYVKEIGTKHLEIHEYKIESKIIPDSFDGLKIVHFSDIHYGTTVNEKELKNIVNEINKLKPDLVFFTGDLFDKDISLDDETNQKIIEILSNIDPTLYKYAIYGDMDNPNKFAEVMEASGFIILNNESKLLYYNDNTPIVITGLNTSNDYSILTNIVDEVDTTNLYKIVLVHKPDEYNKIKPYKPDLTLAGHTLGGLVRIPGLKPLYLQEGAKTYYKDYYREDNKDLYISNGVGTTKLLFRISNHPSINFYRIYKIS